MERPLSLDEYARYGRQMIMREWGLPGQLRLKGSKVAVVGAGGLGCPVLQYLVGAGVGGISIFDHDTVSISNLHRQVLHSCDNVGMRKVDSARAALYKINPNVELYPHAIALLPDNVVALLAGHDLVLDCTDSPYTRYMIADATVALNIPLVSGAAVGSAGQWAVYGACVDGIKSACYRCMWPQATSSARCDEVGVWGPVTGMVGSGMAAEALSVLMGNVVPTLYSLHLGGSPLVRSIKMRRAKPNCVACGENPAINVETENYDAFCGANVNEQTGLVEGEAGERIEVAELERILDDPGDTVVVDTRPEVEYGICALPNTINVPLDTILSEPEFIPEADRLIFLCARGNDSQVAANALRGSRPVVQDVRGGLGAWTRLIDTSFPKY